MRAGNWLLREQASALLNAPDPSTLKGKRDRAMLALLVGCGLRRAELLALEVNQIQQREGRWVIPTGEGQPAAYRANPDAGQGARRRMAPRPQSRRKIFRPVNKGGRIVGHAIADEKAVWQMVLKYARETKLGKLSRTTCGARAPSSAARPAATSNRSSCCSGMHPCRPPSGIWGPSRT